MTNIAAFDLDQTLIYSSRALQAQNEEGYPDLVLAENFDGSPLSYTTGKSEKLLSLLLKKSVVIPSTTRTMEQYKRINLPITKHFQGLRNETIAITSNGGKILIDGEEDLSWSSLIGESISSSSAPLEEVFSYLKSMRDDYSWVLKSRTADNLFAYLIIDLNAIDEEAVETMGSWLRKRNWVMSFQGRKIYAMPEQLTKGRALTHIAKTIPHEKIFSAGDSLLDVSLFEASHESIRPRHGELERRGHSREGTHVTNLSGVRATEEIISFMLDRQ